MGPLHHVVQTATLASPNIYSKTVIQESWKPVFWEEVATITKALHAEVGLHGRAFSLKEWMDLRVITISGILIPLPRLNSDHTLSLITCTARPFMVLARASLGLPAKPGSIYGVINQMEAHVQIILGLQNDILGWPKDHTDQNSLNAIEVLSHHGRNLNEAYTDILQVHNDMVIRMSQMHHEFKGENDMISYYAATLIRSTWAMADWMLVSDRYKLLTKGVL
jgi:hypothetical protein